MQKISSALILSVLIFGTVFCSQAQKDSKIEEGGTSAVTEDGMYYAGARTVADPDSTLYYQIQIYRTTKQWRSQRPVPEDTIYHKDPKTGKVQKEHFIVIKPNEVIPIEDFTLLRSFKIYPPKDEPVTDYFKGLGYHYGEISWVEDPLRLHVTFFGGDLMLSPVNADSLMNK